MAATIGATISDAFFTFRGPNAGPFQRSGGTYVVVQDAVFRAIRVLKSADPVAGSFAELDAAARPTTAVDIWDHSVARLGDTLHIAHLTLSGTLSYSRFDMATDTWLEASTAVDSAVSATGSFLYCHVAVRSTGEAIISYSDADFKPMTVEYGRTSYAIKPSGGSWTAGNSIDGGGTATISYTSARCVLGADDRVHFFYKDDTNNDLYHRTLSAANALSAIPTTPDDTLDAWEHLTAPITYLDGTTTRVRMAYYDASTVAAVAKHDSIDAPSATVDAAISGTLTVQDQRIVADGTTLYSLTSEDLTAKDLTMRVNSAGTWGAATSEYAGAINRLSANVITRGGNIVVGMLLNDGTLYKYAEIVLRTSDTIPPAAPTGLTASVIAPPA